MSPIYVDWKWSMTCIYFKSIIFAFHFLCYLHLLFYFQACFELCPCLLLLRSSAAMDRCLTMHLASSSSLLYRWCLIEMLSQEVLQLFGNWQINMRNVIWKEHQMEWGIRFLRISFLHHFLLLFHFRSHSIRYNRMQSWVSNQTDRIWCRN